MGAGYALECFDDGVAFCLELEEFVLGAGLVLELEAERGFGEGALWGGHLSGGFGGWHGWW